MGYATDQIFRPQRGAGRSVERSESPMSSANALRQLDATTRVLKRAQYECFEFSLASDGIQVRNASYADPENHEYTVRVHDGVPTTCTCPADARYDGACKHRVAVAIRGPVLAAAIDATIAADGSGDSVDKQRGTIASTPPESDAGDD